MSDFADFKMRAGFIQDGPMNEAIKTWHDAQPPRKQTCASPSTLMDCPRVVWRQKSKVEITNPKTWALKQRLLLGRNFENKIAEQLEFNKILLHHWKDDVVGESVKFSMGEDDSKIEGTPDLLIRLGDKIAISDAKTGRSDGYGYVATNDKVWEDQFWYRYKLQLTAYYMLCHKNKAWFKEQGLLLPEICHLFSFALDDGVVRREFTWKPDQEDAAQVIYYTKRWNRAYNAKSEPDCACSDKDAMFCPYADLDSSYTTKKGKTLYRECCK